MPLNHDVASRLAFIRYLHHLGIEQSRLPEPQSSAAVLTLHDAVESFLLLAAEQLGAAPPREFTQYWDALSPAKLNSGVNLAVKQGMVRLNKVRVALKHHGVQPGPAAIAQVISDAAAFFAANTQLVFGVDYDQVSMADVIEQQRVRDLVRVAESAAAGGDYLAAMVALTDAGDMLLTPRRNNGGSWGRSPLLFDETINRAPRAEQMQRAMQPLRDRDGRGVVDTYAHERRSLAEHIESLTEIVTNLQTAARVTALGVDYAAYLRFLSRTPRPSDTIDGKREYRAPKGYAPTQDHYGFCLQFVITTSLQLTETHSHLAPPAWLADEDKAPWLREWETIATGTWPHEGYL
jgi:hypothetical protein